MGADALHVRPLEPHEAPAFEAFLAATPRALIYHSLVWRRFLHEVVDAESTWLVAWTGAEIVGVLPFFTRAVEGVGALINSNPWYGSHGGCLLAPYAPPEARGALIDALAVEIARVDPLATTLVLTPDEDAHQAAYTARLPVRVTDDRISHVTPLPEASEALLGVYRQKTRNLVRKSLKQGFTRDDSGDDGAWRFLFEAHTARLVALNGKAKPWSHFEALRRVPGARLTVARHEGEPVAGLLTIAFGEVVEYIVPVVRPEWRSQQPLSFLIHQGMIEAVEAGRSRWNWGGTWRSQERLRHFKRGWGAEERPYTYLIMASEAGLADLKRHRARLAEAFPYFYAYPFSAL